MKKQTLLFWFSLGLNSEEFMVKLQVDRWQMNNKKDSN